MTKVSQITHCVIYTSMSKNKYLSILQLLVQFQTK